MCPKVVSRVKVGDCDGYDAPGRFASRRGSAHALSIRGTASPANAVFRLLDGAGETLRSATSPGQRYTTERISYSISPSGATTVTTSPSSLPMSARATGELIDMSPLPMSASTSPTI